VILATVTNSEAMSAARRSGDKWDVDDHRGSSVAPGASYSALGRPPVG
jgi:hypothetical protein